MADRHLIPIGRLAAETGCKIETIRYYERAGLLTSPERSSGGHRLYDRRARNRLMFIRHGRDLGFPLEAIRELLALADDPDRSCAAADAIARTRLAEVESRLLRLTALQTELQRMIEECQGGRIADCRVIEVLADHRLCLADDHGKRD
jgi:DNA-binding transcriptional MerR regulator